MKKVGSIVCIIVYLLGMNSIKGYSTELLPEENQSLDKVESIVGDKQPTENQDAIEPIMDTLISTGKSLQSRATGIVNVNNSMSYIAAYIDTTVHTIILDNNITITNSIPTITARNLTIEGGGNTLNYSSFSSTITDGVPNAQIKLQNLIFSNNGVGANIFPHHITATDVTFIAENVTSTGSYFAHCVKGTVIFQGIIDINQPTTSGGVASAKKVIFDSNVQFTSKSAELVHFTNYTGSGVFSIEVRDGAELEVETRSYFMHTEAETQIIIGENATVEATIGNTMSFNDNLDVIKIGKNSDFDISSNYTGNNRVLVFHELIELGDSSRFSLKGKGAGRLIWASRANAAIDIGNDAEFVLENTGTALIDLTSPGTVMFPGQKVETWIKGSDTTLAPTNTVEFTEANTTFAGTVVAVTAIDTDFANNFKPNAYSKMRISKKRRPAITLASTISYEQMSEKTAETFLEDINAHIDIQGVITSNFETIVDMNTIGIYMVTINGVDRFGHVAPTQMVQVNIVDTVAPILSVHPSIVANGVTYKIRTMVEAGDFIKDAKVTADEIVTYTTNFNQVVNLNQVGDYQVTITATDASGNTSFVVVIVHVKDRIESNITEIPEGSVSDPPKTGDISISLSNILCMALFSMIVLVFFKLRKLYEKHNLK